MCVWPQGSEVFDVSWFNESALVLARYTGWGLNATNLRVEPTARVRGGRVCALCLCVCVCVYIRRGQGRSGGGGASSLADTPMPRWLACPAALARATRVQEESWRRVEGVGVGVAKGLRRML